MKGISVGLSDKSGIFKDRRNICPRTKKCLEKRGGEIAGEAGGVVEEGSPGSRDVGGHQLLGLQSLLQGDVDVSSPDRRLPVSTGLNLENTSTTGIEKGSPTSPQGMT